MPNTHLLLSLPDPHSSQLASELLRERLPQCQVIEYTDDCSQQAACRWLQPLPGDALSAVRACLDDAIAILENSRHAFKSAQLAALRKRLSELNTQLSALGDCGKS